MTPVRLGIQTFVTVKCSSFFTTPTLAFAVVSLKRKVAYCAEVDQRWAHCVFGSNWIGIKEVEEVCGDTTRKVGFWQTVVS